MGVELDRFGLNGVAFNEVQAKRGLNCKEVELNMGLSKWGLSCLRVQLPKV
jgi:hypothetical protein